MHLFDEYPRIQRILESLIDDLEESELYIEAEPDDDIVADGPQLKLDRVVLEHSLRSRMISVVAHLSNVDYDEDIHEVTVFSISSEIAKSQTVEYELIQTQISKAVRSRVIDENDLEELVEAVVESLENENIAIGYY